MKRWVQFIFLVLVAVPALGSNGLASPFAPEAAYSAYGGSIERLEQRLPSFYGGQDQSLTYQVTYGTLSAATVFIGSEFGQAGRLGRTGLRLIDDVPVSRVTPGSGRISVQPITDPSRLLPAPHQPLLLPENAESLAARTALALPAPSPPKALLPGVSGTADDIVVIGTRADTLAAEGWPGHKVLNIQNWSIWANDAFIQAAIQQQQTFYLASPINYETLWNPQYNAMKVFGRELGQIYQAGYTRVGDYLIPPAR